jgi:hypothetical protein
MLSSTTNRAQVRHDRMGDIGDQAGVRLVILIRSVKFAADFCETTGPYPVVVEQVKQAASRQK